MLTLFKLACSAILLLSVALLPGPIGLAQPPAPKQPPVVTPWGVSSSASAFRDRKEWFPKVVEAGVDNVRLFPEWNGFQNAKGEWTWENGDSLVKDAAANGLEIQAILMGSPPGAKATHAFPMTNLDDWSKYVSTVVGRYNKHVRHWEVWNEGNGGFNDGKHTTSDYAKLAVATFNAVKKADPTAKVGLSVASYDAPYLHETIRAMTKAGTPNAFDFLCIHPYELADGLADPDGEIPFLGMSRLMREMLDKSAKDKASADIWITEIGRRIEKKKGHEVSEAEAAAGLIKIYTMALAQGITRVQWFEARDPVGEDQGFGLLARDGKARPSFTAMKALSRELGPTPRFLGWLALGEAGRGYGFVFAGKTAPVLVAWMPTGATDGSVTWAADVSILDPVSGKVSEWKAGQKQSLSTTPLLVTGLPESLISSAKANGAKYFPWGGDYSKSKTVSYQPGTANSKNGIYPAGAAAPLATFPDGSTGVILPGDIEHGMRFHVHPTFASFFQREYYVRVTVRRLAKGNVGMNLYYEIADSQGRSPYANTGKWFGSTPAEGWQTYTWHITDACFSKMWGHDFLLRPEQSIPFVLGKVEVSTEPFK